MEFRWNQWNEEHIAKHGVAQEEAEHVVEHATSPFPRNAGDDKFLVWGRGRGGRWLQVIFILDDDGTLFVIHARSLTEREKRRLRRRRK